MFDIRVESIAAGRSAPGLAVDAQAARRGRTKSRDGLIGGS